MKSSMEIEAGKTPLLKARTRNDLQATAKEDVDLGWSILPRQDSNAEVSLSGLESYSSSGPATKLALHRALLS